MISDTQIKQEVREFYNRVGWQTESDGFYQNATYEDLRPVSQEYIHKCHLRVLRHLNPAGRYILDAGSGPIQYPEYLEYSRKFSHRVCADISLVALQEARKRIGEHGLYVVCDVANLPFKSDIFDGEVSLHTFHHLTLEDHIQAYGELHRTLSTPGKAVIINGWGNPPLTLFFKFWIRLVQRLYAITHRQSRSTQMIDDLPAPNGGSEERGTYISKVNASWLQRQVGSLVPIQIWCWRSVSVHFLRTFVHERSGGKFLLSLIYQLEERFPHFLGKYGQYPLIAMTKTP